MEEYKQLIKDPITLRIWTQYFNRVKYVLDTIPIAQRDEIIDELKRQLYDNFITDDDFDDAHRMLNAIDKLGQPEEYAKPIVRDVVLSQIMHRYSPLIIFKRLFQAPFSSFRQLLFSLFMALGYVLLTIVFLISLLKIFVPGTGLYLHDSGELSFGFSPHFNTTEILGYWLIPIGITLSLLMYIALTNILKHISDVKDQ
jgi:uncharacterized membrane protein